MAVQERWGLAAGRLREITACGLCIRTEVQLLSK